MFHRRAVLIPENQKRCDKAVNSPQASKEGTFHILMLMESLCIVVHKYMVGNCFSLTNFQARFRLKNVLENCYILMLFRPSFQIMKPTVLFRKNFPFASKIIAEVISVLGRAGFARMLAEVFSAHELRVDNDMVLAVTSSFGLYSI